MLIDDFARLAIDGKDVKLERPGKGHVENLRAFRAALSGQDDGRPSCSPHLDRHTSRCAPLRRCSTAQWSRFSRW